MKTNHKPLLILLLLLAALTLIFSGCTPSGPEDTSAPVSNELSDTTPETEAGSITPEEYTIVSGGESAFRIVRPAELESEDIPVQAALSIKKSLTEHTDVSLKLGDDWLTPGSEHDKNAFEILVGYTSYPETAEVAASISYGQYAVKAIGNKIVVFSYSEKGYDKAVGKLTYILKNAVTTEADGSKTIKVASASLDAVGTVDEMVSTLPMYTEGVFSSVTDMGDDCYGLIIEDTTAEQYASYVKLLSDGGYTTYSTNEIVGSQFTILYNDTYTINAGFYNNINEVRVIIEPYEDDTLPTKKVEAAPVTTTQLTMLGVEGIYNGEYQNNGLSLIYRLSDGSFVIVDGGHSANSAIYAVNIVEALREQSKDYAKSDSDIRIAAWIITHPHSDHSGTLVKEYKRFAGFKVERIMTNFWPSSAFENNKNVQSNFSGSFSSHTNTRGVADALKADYVVPHVGQVWHFGDTEFEFLYTIESFLPRMAVVYNTSSLVFRTTTTDPSGKQSTTFIPGDATGEALELCTKTFGTYIKSDIVQVTHHGLGNGGSENKISTAYSFIKPSVVLWPLGMHRYNAANDEYVASFNHALFKAQNPEFLELYIAGWQGNSVTLPLPYTNGTAILNKVVETKN